MRYVLGGALVLAFASVASRAMGGPPYLTDDPVPTDEGHWEIYAFTAAEGRRSAFDADFGLDLNYGPVKDVQLTATLPLGIVHETSRGWRAGTGDVEFGVKYRFYHDQKSGVSAAVFPRAILPTSSLARNGRTRLLLPLWVGKDFSNGASVFGGGGFEVNPGTGNRNFWQAAIAVTKEFDRNVSVGAELARQGADALGGTAQTRAGFGGIVKVAGPFSMLMSVGPTWADGRTGYHFYGALGLNL